MDSPHRVRAILSFVHAADGGSFAAAGRTLGVTSAAVSKNVATLEKVLGVRLMNRTTRTLKLTDEGVAFLRRARLALEALDAAVDAVAIQREQLSGRVHITTSVSFGQEHLMPVLPGLLSRHPGLSVEVDFDDRVVDFVRGGYDLALRGGNIRDSALVSRPVCRLNTVLVASPDYLARHGVPRNPSELRQHRLIARRFLGGAVATWSFRATDGGIVTLDPSDTALLTLSAPASLVAAACDGIGIAQVGVHLAWEELVSGRLKIVLHRQYHPGSYEMVIQYPHRALIAPRVRVTVDYLLEAFSADKTLHVPLKMLDAYAIGAT
ncbi:MULTISPECIES: LysR family transcriptional regulator [Xanthomonas]|uniref:LysR family transcriptional regulator n=1 Tax=Xanthomonas TaxID=338 RepID=UPI000E1EB2C3|nr:MULTISPECIES: LysR family transcriptional regulator [Xanthomonas]MEA9578651.1 LysR family transcriptional regulator [Xanthomonas nasturtii]